MRAAVLHKPARVQEHPLSIEELPTPNPDTGFALLKVRACGVCRTDLHIIEGELPPRAPNLVPGHQIVAEVVSSSDPAFPKGARVGVSWIGGTDGTCRYCLNDRENLCDAPLYTGYTHPGGYAQFTTARTDFLVALPDALEDAVAAPLLCAGIIGFRSLRIAEVKPGTRVGLFGFGNCAQLLTHVLHAWNCEVYVATRGEEHRNLARQAGAFWVGHSTDVPSVALDSAITFAPSGEVVLAALRSLAKGGIVAINAIHMDRMPSFDYDTLLWGERQIRSVTNMTRQDAREFLALAAQIKLRPDVTTFGLDQVNEALCAQKEERLDRNAVILPDS